jgi:hypothetical protein
LFCNIVSSDIKPNEFNAEKKRKDSVISDLDTDQKPRFVLRNMTNAILGSLDAS